MRRAVLYVGNYMPSSKGSRAVSYDIGDKLAASGWTVLRTSSVTNKALRLADMVATAVRRRRHYDVAHIDVFSGPAFVYAETMTEAVLALGKPVVLTLHGGGLPPFAELYPKRVARLLSRANLVTAPSGYLKASLAAYRRDIVMIPNPLPVDHYRFRLRDAVRPRLAWLRAFHSIYNPSMALEALRPLVDRFPGIELVMYGPDKGDGSLAQFEQRRKELGLEAAVKLPGWVSKHDVPSVLDQADIFLNTTNADNMPLSVLEAMASGMCVVSTNAGGLPYLVEDGVDGLLVNCSDAPATTAAIERILTEPGLAARLSAGARHKAEQFDWAQVLPMWNRAFLEVLQGQRRGRLSTVAATGPEVDR